jgi:predicted DCC family thiol-disulfide oxidoreductase YuxK
MGGWQIKILIDGACPLCQREARLLRWLDRGRGRLLLEDITAASFEIEQCGVSEQSLMAQIHGVLPDGRLVTGMEVFRRAYAAVGLGWLLAPTRWPVIRPLCDRLYAWFARNRLRLTGRGRGCAADRCRAAGDLDDARGIETERGQTHAVFANNLGTSRRARATAEPGGSGGARAGRRG